MGLRMGLGLRGGGEGRLTAVVGVGGVVMGGGVGVGAVVEIAAGFWKNKIFMINIFWK